MSTVKCSQARCSVFSILNSPYTPSSSVSKSWHRVHPTPCNSFLILRKVDRGTDTATDYRTDTTTACRKRISWRLNRRAVAHPACCQIKPPVKEQQRPLGLVLESVRNQRRSEDSESCNAFTLRMIIGRWRKRVWLLIRGDSAVEGLQ